MKNLYKTSNLFNYIVFFIVYIIFLKSYLISYNNIVITILFSIIPSFLITIVLSLPIKFFFSKIDKNYFLDFDQDEYNKAVAYFTKNHVAETPYFKSIPCNNQYFELYKDKIIIYPSNEEIYFNNIKQIKIYHSFKYFAEIEFNDKIYNFQLTYMLSRYNLKSIEITQNYSGSILGYLLRYLSFNLQKFDGSKDETGIYIFSKKNQILK